MCDCLCVWMFSQINVDVARWTHPLRHEYVHLCAYVCMYLDVCVHVRMCVCLYVGVRMCAGGYLGVVYVCMRVCVCMCVCGYFSD